MNSGRGKGVEASESNSSITNGSGRRGKASSTNSGDSGGVAGSSSTTNGFKRKSKDVQASKGTSSTTGGNSGGSCSTASVSPCVIESPASPGVSADRVKEERPESQNSQSSAGVYVHTELSLSIPEESIPLTTSSLHFLTFSHPAQVQTPTKSKVMKAQTQTRFWPLHFLWPMWKLPWLKQVGWVVLSVYQVFAMFLVTLAMFLMTRGVHKSSSLWHAVLWGGGGGGVTIFLSLVKPF